MTMDRELFLFPLNTVLLPGAMLQLHVFEDRYKTMMAQCMHDELPFGVLLERAGRETGDALDPVDVGTVAVIRQVTRLGAGRLFVIAQGTRRFRIDRVIGTTPFWRAQVTYLNEVDGPGDTDRLRQVATLRLRDYLDALLSPQGGGLEQIELPDDAAASSYIIADALQVATGVKQQLLEAGSATERLRAEVALLNHEIRRLRNKAQPAGRSPATSEFPARFSLN